jgi:hypothetical protein
MKHGEPSKVKAARDVRDLPPELFGIGAAAITRKHVLQTIALWANPDGTEAFPSLATIARACLLTVRALNNIISWLVSHSLLVVEFKASYLNTNKYMVVVSQEAQDACRAEMERDADQQRLTAKAERTRQKRSDAAKARWNKKKTDVERSVPGTSPETWNGAFQDDIEHSVPGGRGTQCIGHGTGCIRRGTQRSDNRPSDLPCSNRQESTDNSTDRFREEHVPAVAGAGPLVPSENPAAKAVRITDRITLIGRIKNVFKHSSPYNLKSTAAHREQAFAMAEQHGHDTFLRALEFWLRSEPYDTFTVKTGEDPRTGSDKFEEKTWLLHDFIESGAALECIENLRPYRHVAQINVLLFLKLVRDYDGPPIEISQEQAAALDGLIQEHGSLTLRRAYFEADEDLGRFLSSPTRYIAAVEA